VKYIIIKVPFVLLFFIVLDVFSLFAQSEKIKKELANYTENVPFSMGELSVPTFPDKKYNIIDFGAVGNGIKKNTEIFRKAIDSCSNSGGGVIIVPAGIWLTGPIILKSNVNLHLERGALIQFTKDFNDYPLIETTYEGQGQYRCISPVYGRNIQNIAITGNGVIDGGGEAWRPVKKYKLTDQQWKELISSGGVVEKNGRTWWPCEQAMNGAAELRRLSQNGKELTKEDYMKVRDFLRPVMVSLINCKNVLLDGVTFQNSPAWNIHPLMCENLILRNINVRNPWYSQNGDGIDIESCKNVILYNSTFDVGDDGICVKSGRDEFGRKRGIPTENLIVADCIVFHGHGGFTIGSEMSGGVKNIKVSNCNFIGTDVGLRFKSTRGRGGVVENIFINNIYMKDIATSAVNFNLYYGGRALTEEKSAEEYSKSQKEIEVDETTPSFRDIYLDSIYCIGAKDAVVLQGLPEMPLKNIGLKNLVMTAENGISMFDVDGIKIDNAEIYTSESPVFYINQGKNVVINNINYKDDFPVFMQLNGNKTANIEIERTQILSPEEKILFGGNVGKNVLKIKK
jgi:polygalacturonase